MLPMPVFWPGEFHGLHSPWSPKELDMTERLSLHFTSRGKSHVTVCSLHILNALFYVI